MSRPNIPTKAKRNNFTISKEAQSILDNYTGNKSKLVSAAIIAYISGNDPTTNDSLTEDSQS